MENSYAAQQLLYQLASKLSSSIACLFKKKFHSFTNSVIFSDGLVGMIFSLSFPKPTNHEFDLIYSNVLLKCASTWLPVLRDKNRPVAKRKTSPQTLDKCRIRAAVGRWIVMFKSKVIRYILTSMLFPDAEILKFCTIPYIAINDSYNKACMQTETLP